MADLKAPPMTSREGELEVKAVTFDPQMSGTDPNVCGAVLVAVSPSLNSVSRQTYSKKITFSLSVILRTIRAGVTLNITK